MRLMRKLSLLVVLFLMGCPSIPPTPPPGPDAEAGAPVIDDAGPVLMVDATIADAGDAGDPDGRKRKDAGVADAAPPAPPSDACGAAEAHLLALKCLDSRGRLLGGPNLHGVKWADICRQDRNNGVDLKPTCIAVKKTCEEVVSSCK